MVGSFLLEPSGLVETIRPGVIRGSIDVEIKGVVILEASHPLEDEGLPEAPTPIVGVDAHGLQLCGPAHGIDPECAANLVESCAPQGVNVLQTLSVDEIPGSNCTLGNFSVFTIGEPRVIVVLDEMKTGRIPTVEAALED